jgi:lipoate-protein ligase A
MSRWRLLLTPAADGAWNMALDEALLARARERQETVLRVYEWARPTLSLGRNQPARGCYAEGPRERHGVDVVRRLTGGRAVLHARELTYSVTAPIVAAEPLRESYERINTVLVAALRALGVAAETAVVTAPAPAPSMAPCFEQPTSGELVVGGRKLVGSAQWRDDGALLQHGSILIDDDQALLAELATEPIASVPAPATLRHELGVPPSAAGLLDALADAVRALEDPNATSLAPDPELLAHAERLRTRYLDAAWTWRR